MATDRNEIRRFTICRVTPFCYYDDYKLSGYVPPKQGRPEDENHWRMENADYVFQ